MAPSDLRGLSYKKVRFKCPKVLVIVRAWDICHISQQCEMSQTLNLRFKHPKLWDISNVFSYRRDLRASFTQPLGQKFALQSKMCFKFLNEHVCRVIRQVQLLAQLSYYIKLKFAFQYTYSVY